MTPLVQVVLESINKRVNISDGGAHPSDESFIKLVFKWLHDQQNQQINSDEVHLWAVKNGWTEKHAKNLSKIAENIDLGKRVVIKFPPAISANFYDDLIEKSKHITE